MPDTILLNYEYPVIPKSGLKPFPYYFIVKQYHVHRAPVSYTCYSVRSMDIIMPIQVYIKVTTCDLIHEVDVILLPLFSLTMYNITHNSVVTVLHL